MTQSELLLKHAPNTHNVLIVTTCQIYQWKIFSIKDIIDHEHHYHHHRYYYNNYHYCYDQINNIQIAFSHK